MPKFVMVKFQGGSKEYCYFTDRDLAVGDHAVVSTPSCKLEVVIVSRISNITQEERSYANKHIQGVVDFFQ